MKIKLASIYVNDPAEAFAFYTGVLGFVEKAYIPEARLAIVASAEEPEGTALLLEPNDNPVAKTYQEALYAAGLPVMVFSAVDIHGECERLRKNGVVFRKEPSATEYGIEALFEDRCGNLIQLHQLQDARLV